MASKAEDAKKLLALFHAAYHATEALHAGVVELSKAAVEKGQENKRATMAAFLGELKQMHAGFNELHHSIGHLMYSECWHDVEVGKEFVDPLKDLLDKLGFGLLGVEVLNLTDPIPDHLPQEVKDKLEEVKGQMQLLKQARAMSGKAHLH
jgi:hypothetical protein